MKNQIKIFFSIKSNSIFYIQLFLIFVCLLNCKKSPSIVPITVKNNDSIHNSLSYLPENLIASDPIRNITARYTDTTSRYKHGILGDKIEAGGILVTINNRMYYFKLNETDVFEDLKPRLFDVDLDGEIEFITIQSNINLGASVAIYKISTNRLQLYLQSNYIGTKNRWLNIAAINDLDNNGSIEIAWVQTPHIGGVLKIASIKNNSLTFLDQADSVSNHEIGSRNLCLSVLTETANQKTLYLSNFRKTAIIGYTFQNNKINKTDSITQSVDFNKPLFQQYPFLNVTIDNNCIFIE